MMKKYLVGGAVRDLLLKLPVREKDWVITGSSPQEMLNIGYEQVGKDFPVFLHPKNHEEYALARTERKSGQGYTGFICYTEPSITIEEDLYRRDLTINAMAYDMNGNLVDPYNGQRDIALRLLRHVSNAFYEDPLRVLRVARFAARFQHMGFTIAPETLILMTKMTNELESLSLERVWMETKKALITNSPQIYFQILRKCGALKILFPELDMLFSIPNPKKQDFHINNLGEHFIMKLSNISCLSKNLAVRFSMLCCNLRKKLDILETSINPNTFFNKSKISLINDLCNRLKVPNNIYKLAQTVSTYYDHLWDFTILSPEIIMTIFKAFNCWRIPKQIEHIIIINKSNLLEGKYNKDYIYLQEKFLRTAFMITTQVKTNDIIKDGFTGSDISKELYSRRLSILSMWYKKKIFKIKNY